MVWAMKQIILSIVLLSERKSPNQAILIEISAIFEMWWLYKKLNLMTLQE